MRIDLPWQTALVHNPLLMANKAHDYSKGTTIDNCAIENFILYLNLS
jgi:hypothetical protein